MSALVAAGAAAVGVALVGAAGVGVVGTGVGVAVTVVGEVTTPSHGAELILQLTGWPPEPTKPKLVLAPTATDPFHPRSAKVTCCPDSVISASQKLPIDAPAGRSNSTFHEVMAAA